jgi:pre-mRNA cleavage complex 2 protein Pcf11
MENMLQTWKGPVPGSIDSRPVFPPENVRPIDNALIKAKTAAIQNQRQVQPPQVAYRGTSTPPQMHGQFALPQNQSHQQLYPGSMHQQVSMFIFHLMVAMLTFIA